MSEQEKISNHEIIYAIQPIEFRLDLKDPFLFTAHHIDHFPIGNEQMQPVTPPTDDKPYRMYYSETGVPGFPEHPHTGFETITFVESGYVDHFDSLGNSGRYGAGDVQWLSTGNGIEHCEMFPLLHTDKENPFELFQIWFNSSPQEKTEDPAYKMMWREHIPHVIETDAQGVKADIRVVSGEFKSQQALERPKNSWAHAKENKVNIFMIQLDPHAELTIPATTATSNRFCYFYNGPTLEIEGEMIPFKHLVELKSDVDIHLKNGAEIGRIMWLEGEPIDAPVAMRGPFVLNSDEELNTAFARYRQTHFGKWPWESTAPVFKRDQPRFTSYNKGEEVEYPETAS